MITPYRSHDRVVGPLAVLVFLAVTVLTVFGAIIMVLNHNSPCSRFNPLIGVDLSEGVVTVRNGEKVCPVAKVHSLIAATVSDSEGVRYFETQLIVHHGDSLLAALVGIKS